MSSKVNFGSDESFIQKYDELKSSRLMGIYYNCSKSAVLDHAKKIGYNAKEKQENNSKLSKEDKKFIIENYNTYTSTELAEKFNVSRGMITKIWHNNNLTGKKRTVTKLHLEGKKINNLTVIEKTSERNASGSILWRCKCDCGNEVLVSSARLNSGEAKSCGCLSKEALKIGQGLNFSDKANKKYGKLTALERCEDKILNNKSFVQWLCKCECGRIVKVLAGNLETGNTQSCGLCSNNSHGNIKIEQLLKEYNIPFEREKRFETCIDKTYLPFDFFVNNSYLIEFDGKQHYLEDSFFHTEDIKKHDLIKSNWCKNNNIPLIRIPYTHYKDLKIEDLKLETSNFIEK